VKDWTWKLAVGVVLVAAFLAHGGSLGGGFVYDDHRFIEHNAALRDLSVPTAFTDPATASHGDGIQHDIYRPLRTILFSLEYQLFAREGEAGQVDFHLRWWHLVSVLLHALNALLVLRLLKPLVRGDVWIAGAGALLFAVHPLTSESVAWLSSQGDLLAMTFLLTALVVLERTGVRPTVVGALCFALACFSKESALVLPALLPLRDLALPRGIPEHPSPWARSTWIRVAILSAVAALYFLIRLQVLPGLAQVDHPGGSMLASARGMASALAWYAGALLWPVGFSFDTRLDVPYHWTDPAVWVGLGILGSTLAAGVHGLLRRRYLLAFAALGFLVFLGPVSNILVPLKTFVADRFLYPGLVCIAAAVATGLLGTRGALRSALLTVLCCVLAGFTWMTAERNRAWAGEASLWTAVLEDRPENANAYQGLAFEYGKEGRVAEAERALSSYLEANPNDGKSLRYMGDLFGRVADGLVQLYYVDGTNHAQRRQQARVAQIGLYRRALQIWDRPGGLLFGRGSEAMRAEMLEKWIEAAVDLGDVRSAKFANDRAIDLEARGRGYTHEDLAAVQANASWWRRRARVLLALRSVQASMDKDMPEEMRPRLEADRRAVLEDVGIDARLGPQALLHPLRLQVDALIREALDDPELVPDVGLFLHRASLLAGEPGMGNAAGIQALEEALRVHPRHPAILARLRVMQAPRSGGQRPDGRGGG
jgi:tetratricopeptide (TPR) repeat protein